MRPTLLVAATLLAVAVAVWSISPAVGAAAIDELPPTYVPSGKAMFAQYCAACHGPKGKGDGPAALTLKTPPADLTTLTERHTGKFPREYVENILRFGPGVTAHGSSDMPTWGSIFQLLDKNKERVVQQRIKNLTDHIASLQNN